MSRSQIDDLLTYSPALNCHDRRERFGRVWEEPLGCIDHGTPGGLVCNLLDSSMSHSIWGRRADRPRRPTANTAKYSAGFVERGGLQSDNAIDAALRSVPLPEGLLTRLGMVAYTVSEDSSGKHDWLGC